MALSQEILKILIVALADKQAGEELFAAINNSLPISKRTLEFLIVAMADKIAALRLAIAIESSSYISEHILEILTVCLTNKEAGLAIKKQLTQNVPPTINGHDFYIYCKDIFDNCYASYSGDATALADCNNDPLIGWPALYPDYEAANTAGTVSCTAVSGGADDWFCGMSDITGYPFPNDEDCTGGL